MVTPTIAYINFFPNPSGSLIPRVKNNNNNNNNSVVVYAVATCLSCTVMSCIY